MRNPKLVTITSRILEVFYSLRISPACLSGLIDVGEEGAEKWRPMLIDILKWSQRVPHVIPKISSLATAAKARAFTFIKPKMTISPS